MGCDIHLHIEIKLSGKWHHYGAPCIDRSYKLFSKMAGVRGEETPISSPKGLPSDVTEVTALDAARWGGHSHSWLGTSEIEQLSKWLGEQKLPWPQTTLEYGWLHTYLFGNDFSLGGEVSEVQDIRFVFWFDS